MLHESSFTHSFQLIFSLEAAILVNPRLQKAL